MKKEYQQSEYSQWVELNSLTNHKYVSLLYDKTRPVSSTWLVGESSRDVFSQQLCTPGHYDTRGVRRFFYKPWGIFDKSPLYLFGFKNLMSANCKLEQRIRKVRSNPHSVLPNSFFLHYSRRILLPHLSLVYCYKIHYILISIFKKSGASLRQTKVTCHGEYAQAHPGRTLHPTGNESDRTNTSLLPTEFRLPDLSGGPDFEIIDILFRTRGGSFELPKIIELWSPAACLVDIESFFLTPRLGKLWWT